MNWKKCVVAVHLCIATFSLAAQTATNGGSILATVFSDPGVKAQTNIVDFQRQTSTRLPLLDQVSLRTETDEFRLARQRYATRFSVNGLLEKRQYRKWMQTSIQVAETGREDRFLSALYDRYNDLADYYAIVRTLPIQQQLLVVYNDKLKVLETLAASDVETDLKEMMQTEYERDELLVRIQENATQQAHLEQHFGALMYISTPTPIDTAGWMSPQKMFERLNGIVDSSITTPDVLEKEAKIAQIKAEYQLEKARSHQMLDFIQFRYADKYEDPFRFDASISMGFTLPYNGTRNAKKNLLSIEQHSAEQELLALRNQVKEAVQENWEALNNTYQQHQLLHSQIQQSEKRYATAHIATLGPDGVEALLQLRELQLKRQLKLQATEDNIREQYLEILFLSGRLSEKPLINYLQANLATW